MSDSVETAPRYDDSAWPLFVVELPLQRMAPEVFDAHLARCHALFERGEPFSMLVDATNHPPLLPIQRSAMTEALRRDGERYQRLCLGLALVLRSSFERSVAHSIQSLARTTHPFAIFSTIPEAMAWLATHDSRLSDSGPAIRRGRQVMSAPSRFPRASSSAPPFRGRFESMAPLGRRSRDAVLPPASFSLEPAPPPSSAPVPASSGPRGRASAGTSGAPLGGRSREIA